MALVTAEQLKDSLEGTKAQEERFQDEVLEQALAEAQALLNVTVAQLAGVSAFDVEATYEDTHDKYKLAQKFVRMAAVRGLEPYGPSNVPTPSGAVLTGLTSEGADFTFFTPSGDSTGYADLDRLAQQIASGRRSAISSIRMVRQ